jgi:hypothetical protein
MLFNCYSVRNDLSLGTETQSWPQHDLPLSGHPPLLSHLSLSPFFLNLCLSLFSSREWCPETVRWFEFVFWFEDHGACRAGFGLRVVEGEVRTPGRRVASLDLDLTNSLPLYTHFKGGDKNCSYLILWEFHGIICKDLSMSYTQHIIATVNKSLTWLQFPHL